MNPLLAERNAEICRLSAAGHSFTWIGRQYGITYSRVSQIVKDAARPAADAAPPPTAAPPAHLRAPMLAKARTALAEEVAAGRREIENALAERRRSLLEKTL